MKTLPVELQSQILHHLCSGIPLDVAMKQLIQFSHLDRHFRKLVENFGTKAIFGKCTDVTQKAYKTMRARPSRKCCSYVVANLLETSTDVDVLSKCNYWMNINQTFSRAWKPKTSGYGTLGLPAEKPQPRWSVSMVKDDSERLEAMALEISRMIGTLSNKEKWLKLLDECRNMIDLNKLATRLNHYITFISTHETK